MVATERTDELSPSWQAAISELDRRRARAHGLGGPDRIARHHQLGFLTARERIDLLIDPGSAVELGELTHSQDLSIAERTPGDGLVAGFGRVEGRWVCYFATDATIKGGSGGDVVARRKAVLQRIAEHSGLPTIDIAQGGGGRIDDMMSSRFTGGYGPRLGSELRRPRRGPHLTAVAGSYFAPWYVPLSDFATMTRSSTIAIASPPIVEEATGHKVTAAELGDAEILSKVTGQIDMVANDDAEAIAQLKEMLSFLPSNAFVQAPVRPTADSPERCAPELRTLLPESLARAYDMRRVLRLVVDDGHLFELAADYARNLITAFARLDGHPVGIMANQPLHLAGSVDHQAFLKARRLSDVCRSFGIPLLFFADTPGVLVAIQQEQSRILTKAMNYLRSRFDAVTPAVTVVLRKSYGLAYWVMNGNAIGPSMTFAWPSARIAFMGPEPAVRVTYRRELEAAADARVYLQQQAARWQRASEPWEAARLAYLDDVIDPAETRPTLIRALRILREAKRRV